MTTILGSHTWWCHIHTLDKQFFYLWVIRLRMCTLDSSTDHSVFPFRHHSIWWRPFTFKSEPFHPEFHTVGWRWHRGLVAGWRNQIFVCNCGSLIHWLYWLDSNGSSRILRYIIALHHMNIALSNSCTLHSQRTRIVVYASSLFSHTQPLKCSVSQNKTLIKLASKL